MINEKKLAYMFIKDRCQCYKIPVNFILLRQ